MIDFFDYSDLVVQLNEWTKMVDNLAKDIKVLQSRQGFDEERIWFLSTFDYWTLWVLRGINITRDELMDYFKQYTGWLDTIKIEKHLDEERQTLDSNRDAALFDSYLT